MPKGKPKDGEKAEYQAVERVWHSREERFYEPGSPIKLDHLESSDVLALIERGIVKLVKGQRPQRILEQVKGIDQQIARELWNIGVKTLEDFVEQDPRSLAAALRIVSLERIVGWQILANRMIIKEEEATHGENSADRAEHRQARTEPKLHSSKR